MLKKLFKKDHGAFTLIELMVVMAIIAILITLIIGAITVARRTTRDTQRRSNVQTIKTALEGYYAANKLYPDPDSTGTANATSSLTIINGLFTPALTLSDPLGDDGRICYVMKTASTYELRLLSEAIGAANTFTSCTTLADIAPVGEKFDLK